MHRLFRPLVYLIVPTAAFLTFLLQPIVGKELMPRYGGTAGTWMTISLFFQAALLGGYALAAALVRRNSRRSGIVVMALALAAPLTAKLPPWYFSRWSEWPAVLAGLALALLPTVLLTTSIGIVVQGWIRRRDGRVPYWLYGISNLGSLIALLLYPFVIEPRIGLHVQVWVVHALLWMLGLATCWVAWSERSVAPEAADETTAAAAEVVPWARVRLWMAVAFLTCTLMLGGVRILSAEIGSNPLAWLIPLGTYLLSFTLTFSGWWRRSSSVLAVLAFGVALFGYMATKGFSNDVLLYWPRLWLIVMLAGGTLAGHGFLYELRPTHRFSFFYLAIATAGVLAGLFASVGAPLLFDRNVEFAGAAFVLLPLVGAGLIARGGWIERGVFAAIAIAPSGWLAADKIIAEHELVATKLTYLRNYYSSILLTDSRPFLMASNETTLHGTQFHDPAKKNTPTTYYTRGSAAGMVIQAMQRKLPSIRIGVIGLGTGTLAAYPRAADEIVFWDINPLALHVARDYFTFLKDCPGHVDVRLMDGRIGARQAKERFDILIVDAFSGDYVPLHLITREALQDYRQRVGDGIILFHISNRYTDLAPVIATSARRLGLEVLSFSATPGDDVKVSEEAARTKYVIVYPHSRDKELDDWVLEQLKDPDYHYTVGYPDEQHAIDWTDDRHAIFDVLWKS